jgi:hypothetical protein
LAQGTVRARVRARHGVLPLRLSRLSRSRLTDLTKSIPPPPLCLGNASASGCSLRPGRQPAVKPAAPFSRHHSHDAWGSGSGLGAAPRSEFPLQWQPSVRETALEHLATPTPFSTDYFRACTSGSRVADNSVHQLSLMISPVRSPKSCKTP